jgi:hypothetical protein
MQHGRAGFPLVLFTFKILKMSIIESQPILAPLSERTSDIPALPAVMIEPLVRATLLEDLGRAGDLTSDAIIPAQATVKLRLAARQQGVLAGLDPHCIQNHGPGCLHIGGAGRRRQAVSR